MRDRVNYTQVVAKRQYFPELWRNFTQKNLWREFNHLNLEKSYQVPEELKDMEGIEKLVLFLPLHLFHTTGTHFGLLLLVILGHPYFYFVLIPFLSIIQGNRGYKYIKMLWTRCAISYFFSIRHHRNWHNPSRSCATCTEGVFTMRKRSQTCMSEPGFEPASSHLALCCNFGYPRAGSEPL